MEPSSEPSELPAEPHPLDGVAPEVLAAFGENLARLLASIYRAERAVDEPAVRAA